MIKTIQVTLVCLSMLFACFMGPQAAAQTRDYIVEMIVFKRPQASAEAWPKTIDLIYPDYRAYFTGDRPPASAKSGNRMFGELGPSSYLMANSANRLNGQRGHKVLFHKAWRQSIGPRGKAPALVILGGDNSAGMRELSGYVKLELGRYLHVNANLWLTEFGNSNDPDSVWPDLPSPFERQTSASQGARVNTTADRSENFGVQRDHSSRRQNGIQRIATLSQKRRMRSNEPHYIDHSRLGVLIEIRKIEK